MQRLIVHIGTHKTGSTAIQRALKSASGQLRADGLVFVPTPRDVWRFETATDYDQELADSCRAAFLASLEGSPETHTAVLSCEAFCGDPSTGYANMPVLARLLAHMAEGFDTTIVVYLRRQDSFVESAYTQLIHQGGSLGFDEFLGGLPDGAFDWGLLLETYAGRFGADAFVVRRYDRAFLPERTSILDDFAQVIGANALPEARGEGSPNRGYNRDALEVARLANPHLEPEQRHELRLMLQETSAKAPFESYALFTVDARREFLARFDDSNARIAREHLDLSDGALFPPPVASTESPYPGLTTETAVRVLSAALAGRPDRTPADTAGARLGRRVEQRVSRALDRTPKLKSRIAGVFRRRGLL